MLYIYNSPEANRYGFFDVFEDIKTSMGWVPTTGLRLITVNKEFTQGQQVNGCGDLLAWSVVFSRWVSTGRSNRLENRKTWLSFCHSRNSTSLYTRPGYDWYSSPWFFDGPNRNRWFTELENGGSFHGYYIANVVFSLNPKPSIHPWFQMILWWTGWLQNGMGLHPLR